MNIIIGAFATATALYLRIKFHDVAKKTNIWFLLSVFVGLVSALTVIGRSFWAELGFCVLALLVCGFVLTLYKLEINRAFARRRALRKRQAVSTAQLCQSSSRYSQKRRLHDDGELAKSAA